MRLPAWGTKADGRSRSSRLAAVVQTAARRIGHARPSPTESAETAPCWPKASERPWMVDIALRALAGRQSRTARSSEPDGIAGLRRADDKALSADRQSLRRRRADLIPQASLRWNSGVHNWMTYVTGDIPVGAYDPMRLANLGIGHGAIDFGGGYSYFDEKTGHEFSGTLGFTYNMLNQDTQYRNGIDMQIAWGMSQFLTKQLQI